jgi:pyruvate dehydrogenase E1 component
MLKPIHQDIDPIETEEWVDSLDEVIQRSGPERAAHLLEALHVVAAKQGVDAPGAFTTPYVNTVPVDRQPEFPGDIAMERRIKSIIRWNAMVMVMRAKNDVGGHISTYASAATLLEVGFNHFFRGPDHPEGQDFIYFQGHASPGVYARSFLEGRFDETKLKNFRHEMAPGGGLSSYPHPWLMPDYWQFPTVSMGLGPITSLYHARFLRYLEYRGLKDTSNQRVWCFIGDGELDEPETLGPIHLASRDNLDNLVYVVNCNLQRLDGPVRGNGKVIQEMESFFKGAGWNVVKCIWGSEWDPLLEADKDGLLVRRMGEILDGDYQKYVVSDGEYFMDHFCGPYPQLRELMSTVPIEKVHHLRRGGHDPRKVYAAYKAAVDHVGAPTVVLVKTVKGYGLGEGGEGFNTAHQIKKIQEDEKRIRVMKAFRDRFEIPIKDADLDSLPFYHPGKDSPEAKYIRERREKLGGFVPTRRDPKTKVEAPKLEEFNKLLEGSPKDLSTTQVFVGALGLLLRNKAIGKQVIPIVPDEARTFGMEGLMSTYGIWSPHGQNYSPVDSETLAPYREAKNGQAFEEGINEAGAMSTFIAAASSYVNHGIPTIPFYIYYSMFGFQRIGDQIWLAGDQRCKGFLLGATAGRTTLNGEGLQHQDGHSHLAASAVPNCVAYDPAFGYELAVIIQDGIRRMYQENEDVLYYITLYNEKHLQPPMPKDSIPGILKGIYKFRSADATSPKSKKRVRLLGSGAIMPGVLEAQKMLAEKFGVSSDVYSVTSYKELRREALDADRWNFLHPTEPAKTSYVQELLGKEDGPIVSASDNVRLVAEQIAPWTNGRMTVLGTDGFGRSESRQTLRRHFEVDAPFVAFAALSALARQGEYPQSELAAALASLEIDPEKLNPMSA